MHLPRSGLPKNAFDTQRVILPECTSPGWVDLRFLMTAKCFNNLFWSIIHLNRLPIWYFLKGVNYQLLLFIYLFIYLFIHLFIYLFVYLFFWGGGGWGGGGGVGSTTYRGIPNCNYPVLWHCIGFQRKWGTLLFTLGQTQFRVLWLGSRLIMLWCLSCSAIDHNAPTEKKYSLPNILPPS